MQSHSFLVEHYAILGIFFVAIIQC